jgi:uncharacterized membrane protein YhhN
MTLSNKYHTVFTGFYFILMFVVITVEWFELKWLYYVTKPAMVITLLWYFLTATKGEENPIFRNLIAMALVFCVAGDTLLMFVNESEYYFLGGLVAFLTGHLFYTAAFTFEILKNRPWKQHWGQLAFSTLIVVFGVEFYIINRESFGSMWLPVLLYCSVITIMGVTATMRDSSAPRKGFYQIIGGACLFIISDSLLATNKFIVPFYLAGPMILITYFSAQYLIVKGCIHRVTTPKTKENHSIMMNGTD